jgi:long-subunit fatty acid transport protein
MRVAFFISGAESGNGYSSGTQQKPPDRHTQTLLYREKSSCSIFEESRMNPLMMLRGHGKAGAQNSRNL